LIDSKGENKELCLLKFPFQTVVYLQMIILVANNSYLEELKIFTILQIVKGIDFFDRCVENKGLY